MQTSKTIPSNWNKNKWNCAECQPKHFQGIECTPTDTAHSSLVKQTQTTPIKITQLRMLIAHSNLVVVSTWVTTTELPIHYTFDKTQLLRFSPTFLFTSFVFVFENKVSESQWLCVDFVRCPVTCLPVLSVFTSLFWRFIDMG